MNDNRHYETPAEASNLYLAEVNRTAPAREPPKRWSKPTIIFVIVEVGIAAAVLA